MVCFLMSLRVLIPFLFKISASPDENKPPSFLKRDTLYGYFLIFLHFLSE